jgi:hypothetical protein
MRPLPQITESVELELNLGGDALFCYGPADHIVLEPEEITAISAAALTTQAPAMVS